VSLTVRSRTFPVLDMRASGRWPGDVLAVAALVVLPVLVFGVPALLGHAVLPGDDLTQNFPLRVLAGQQIRGGQLPLYNPYIWSGAPLLGSWNAGAAYPFTLLFTVFPATAAWTLNLIITWAVAGLGMFVFLRALRLGSLPAFLGALSFGFAGAMSAQVAHFGLVAGMSWVPVQLLAVLRLTETRGTASRLGWTAVLGAAIGLTILAGEPRAIDDAGVIVLIYAAWRIARLHRRCGPAAVSVAAGVLIGGCLGAVQWLPGLAAIGTSQRAASTVALFNSGSLPHKWLLLMLVPDLLGGSGSFGQPAFLAPYNLTEVTGYAGIFPLIAALVLLGRLRLRPRLPEWAVWHGMAVAGILLALGGNTPLGALLVRLPFFGDQRLQSRNILVADLALAVLLAYWADRPFAERDRRFLRGPGNRRVDLETLLGALAPLAVIAVVVLGLTWGAGFLHWLGVRPGSASMAGRLQPWLVPYALIGGGAIAFVVFGRRLRPGLRSRWLGWFVLADVVVFTVLAVVAVGSGLRGGLPAAAGHGTRPPASAIRPSRADRAGVHAPAPRPIASLGYPGRFAIYDPGELDAHELSVLGAPDLNATTGTPSVQGYTSIVDGRYAAATGAHQATGDGQDVLAPRAIADGTLDQLDTARLLTVPGYLITSGSGSAAPAGPPGTGQRDVAADQQGTWYLATALPVSKLDLPDAEARQDAATGTRVGLVTPDGSTRWFRANAASGSLLTIDAPHPVASVAIIGRAGSAPGRLGPPSVTDPAGRVFVADGQLQNALVPPRWVYAGQDGSFAVFADRFARGPLTLQALSGRPVSGAWVRALAGPAVAPTTAAVFTPHGARVVRSAAAIPGWSATWQPRRGAPVALAVRRAGLVQAVDVPPGRGVLTWSYIPPGGAVGGALSLGALALILLLLTAAVMFSRRVAVRADPASLAPRC
jgi:hypothetical protein